MTTPTEREFAVEVVRRLREAGHEALWAGGCVRDELLGQTPKDYDVATSALPEQVRRLFRRTVGVGEAFLVVEILGPRTETGPLKVQAATFRSDGEYIDERRPVEVVASTPREDALRRDFTINGMFFDPLENRIIDYVGGQDDLRNRVLRAIGDAEKRIGEDKLRMMRAVRMAARFELTVEPATAAAIRKMAPGIPVVSAERIADEFRKMLVDRHRARGMRLFVELGLAAPVLPELLPMMGLPQGLPRRTDPPCRRPAGPRPRTPPASTCGSMSCACWTCWERRRRSPWRSPRSCTTWASRAPSAGRRIATPSTATNTSAAAWRPKSACASKRRMRSGKGWNGWWRNTRSSPTPGR